MEDAMGPELVLALIGIGIAVVLLAVLAVLQQTRIKTTKEEIQTKVREEVLQTADASPGKTPFFVACFRGNKARFFRVYLAPDALLFLNAGPFFILIDPETIRGSDDRHWMMRSVKLLFTTLITGAAVFIFIFAILLRASMKNAHNEHNPALFLDTMQLFLGIGGLLAAGAVIAIPALLWHITQRGQQLDSMTLQQLRAASMTEEWSFCATPQNLSEIELKLRTGDFETEEILASLLFRQQPSGKWNIETMTTQDTQTACEAFRAVFGDRAMLDMFLT